MLVGPHEKLEKGDDYKTDCFIRYEAIYVPQSIPYSYLACYGWCGRISEALTNLVTFNWWKDSDEIKWKQYSSVHRSEIRLSRHQSKIRLSLTGGGGGGSYGELSGDRNFVPSPR